MESGNRIRELRVQNKMTQAELAAQINAKKNTVSRYETGVRGIDTDTIRRLCEIFHVTADYLLGISSQRTLRISDDDAELVAAYHAADPDARQIVDLALGLNKKEEKNKSEAS